MCDLNGKKCAPALFSSCSVRVKESFEKYGLNTSPTIATASATSSFLSSTSSFLLLSFLFSSCLIMILKTMEATYSFESPVYIRKNAIK